jgi:glycosyltransferase involved in cell wall biosynthesis
VPGCREVVQQNMNGFLCRVRNAPDLADKMEQMLQMPEEQLQKMGEASRHIAETKFDVNFVIQRYLHGIDEVTAFHKV